MRKIKRRKNYIKYILIITICVFSCMGIGYSYLQETLSIHMSLSKKGMDITDDVVTAGDGLYEDKYDAGRYIYRGNEPDNYIWFNEELWRIIAKETDGTYKIIKDEIFSEQVPFDEANHRLTENNTYCTMPNYGCGVFAKIDGIFQIPDGTYKGTVTEDSTMYEYLNETYYKKMTSDAKNQIQFHTYNIGPVQKLMDETDSIRKNIEGEKMYSWTGNVGLINVSDTLKASLNASCVSVTAAVENKSRTICDQNYLFHIDVLKGYWTINAFAVNTEDLSYGVWSIYRDEVVTRPIYDHAQDLDKNSYIRPVVFLKSTIQFLAGDGTKENPYQIK